MSFTLGAAVLYFIGGLLTGASLSGFQRHKALGGVMLVAAGVAIILGLLGNHVKVDAPTVSPTHSASP
jgi:hypothetical protein